MSTAGKNAAISWRYGFIYLALFLVAGQLVNMAIQAVITNVDPIALQSLNQPLPVYNVPGWMIWVMIPVSILVVGPVEEFLFRGFIFGGLLRIYGARYWRVFAILTSALFAAVHLYYLFIFGVASLFFFVDIFAVGLALSFTYYRSGGSLVAPVFLHGIFDASAFLGNATSLNVTIAIRFLITAIGLILYLISPEAKRHKKEKQVQAPV